MIRYLTPEQVLFIHDRLIKVIGGEHGVRDLSMLLYALGRPQATFDNRDLYPDLFNKAAALMDSLIRNHPFVMEINEAQSPQQVSFYPSTAIRFI